MPSIQDVFAANVRKYRKAAHLSQEKLAELSGLHRTYIGGIEQRRVNPSLKNVGKIATALAVDPALLFLSDDGAAQGLRPGRRKAPQRGDSNEDALDRTGTASPRIEYALVSWHGDQVTVRPIEVTYENLTAQILCDLVLDGFHGDELAARYREVHTEILRYLDA